MLKIFSFVASCAGERSNTARFSDMLADSLRVRAAERGEEIQYERMTGDGLRVDFCRSCESCFRKGVCPLDASDDMDALKRKILDCDIFLFGSPVYIASMSGLAKSVLDRLAYWSHRFELAGKTGAVLVTTSNNHGPETVEETGKILRYMGLSLAYAGCAYIHEGKPKLFAKDEMAAEVDSAAGRLLDCLDAPEGYIEPWQDIAFRLMNKRNRQSRAFYDVLHMEPWNETLVCEQRGMERCKSLREYVSAVRKKDSRI